MTDKWLIIIKHRNHPVYTETRTSEEDAHNLKEQLTKRYVNMPKVSVEVEYVS